MPGAGMLEAAAAGARCLLPDSSPTNSAISSGGILLCITNASIPAPLVLSAEAAGVLEVCIDCVEAHVQLRSMRQGSPGNQQHFRASLGTLGLTAGADGQMTSAASTLTSTVDIADETAVGPTQTNELDLAVPAKLLKLSLGSMNQKALTRVRCTAVVHLDPNLDLPNWGTHPAVAGGCYLRTNTQNCFARCCLGSIHIYVWAVLNALACGALSILATQTTRCNWDLPPGTWAGKTMLM